MPHAAVMMKLTERTELLFVWFRSFDVCQCPGIKARFYLTGVNHSEAHRTRSKDGSGTEVWTMKNVAVVTNLGIYRWTIKQSCSAWNGTRWTHVPWCVQSHVKTQLTFWQKSPFLFSLAVLCSRASLSCVWSLQRLGSGTLRSSDYHIYIHFTERSSFFFEWREGKCSNRNSTNKVRSESAEQSERWCCGHAAHQHVFGMTFPLFMSRAESALWCGLGVCPQSNLITRSASTYPSSLIEHRGDSWHSAVCKRPLKTRRASVLGYIKVISCQASRKHPPPSASKTADWSRHPVWHIWARESNENSCFCPYGIQRLAAWRCALPTLGKLSIINPEIWPAYELLLIKTSGEGGTKRGEVSFKRTAICDFSQWKFQPTSLLFYRGK